MGMVAADLADAITIGLGQNLPSPPEVLGFAQGIIESLTEASAGFGSGIPGPYSISGLTGSGMAAKVKAAAGYPSVSSELQGFCSGIADGISAGFVFYTGPPPPAVPNFFLGGTITGVSGSVMAAGAGFPSVTSQLLGMCDAIANYIMANAEVVAGVIS